ncbi:cyclin-J-like protein [Latimeria chalumnae]|uniref:Cyclin-J-like protein n=1 Tax=Latimeria chalumnae TaxID=7897 RepID=H3ARH6_LATCH|nr:PREDICTED: cyclin-J-like protein [Latimeria chalumnae]|eukprot:XP_006002649.1 PREDICTED: cyclin-J-like protein [Latimeria chalumnae]
MGRMELEEQWWKGQLAADIHQALRIKELKLPAYRAHSPQIGMRRYFADLLAILSNRYQLCPTARHLAVYLLDLFMEHYDVAVKQLYVIALSCLLLASKFEEKEDRVPKLEQLNNLGFMCSLNLVLNKKDLLKMELLLLETFNWNLCMPTAAHFTDYYLFVSVYENDLHNSWSHATVAKTKVFMDKYTQYFLEVSLQDHAFLRFRPSQVAAACIAASRICLNISPSWTTQLHLLTGYSWEHLTPCVELLLIAHDSDVKEASKAKSQQVSFQQPQAVPHQHQATPQSLLFQQAPYQQLPQNSTPLSHFHSPAHSQDLCLAFGDALQAHRPGAASASVGSARHSYAGLQASLQPTVIPIQGPIAMQVAIATEPRHCISMAYGTSILNGHHSFATGCFDR